MRKAAILVASLDRAAADRLLDRMQPEQAQQVRQMVIELDPIDPEEQRRVINEFFRVRPARAAQTLPGIELEGRLASRLALGPESAGTIAGREEARASCPHAAEPASGRPFRFLDDAEGEKLAALIAGERPQMIALVLAHLDPRQAGNVLVRLPPALQVDVIRRLVDLEETDPEILREVERALEARFSEQVVMQRRRVAGLAAVAEILDAVEAKVGMQIRGNLSARDRLLAERLGPPPPDFVELASLDDLALAAVLREAGAELVALALIGEEPALIERVLGCIAQPDAGFIRDQLEHPGPTRLSDVEQARSWIARLAQQMALQGRIEFRRGPQRSRFAFALA